MKMRHSKLFQGKYLFPGGSTYLLVNKYWGSSYFPVNNYWGVLFPREYLLTVTPVFSPYLEKYRKNKIPICFDLLHIAYISESRDN